MNWMEELKRVLKKYWWVLLIFLAGVPFGIHSLYKVYLGVPFLVGAFDADAMLGFYGSVLGGFVTLLVLWITTDETRKIQQKNEQQLEDDKKEREREKRKAFTDLVADDVAKFIADTTVFADKYRNYKKAENNKKDLEKALKKVRDEIVKNANDMAASGEPDMDYAAKNTELNQKKEELLRRIDICERHMEIANINASKIVALERYTALCIKLRGLEDEDIILNKMIEVNANVRDADIDFEVIAELQDELVEIITEFTKKYIEKG